MNITTSSTTINKNIQSIILSCRSRRRRCNSSYRSRGSTRIFSKKSKKSCNRGTSHWFIICGGSISWLMVKLCLQLSLLTLYRGIGCSCCSRNKCLHLRHRCQSGRRNFRKSFMFSLVILCVLATLDLLKLSLSPFIFFFLPWLEHPNICYQHLG